jgi:hypothetical protein
MGDRLGDGETGVSGFCVPLVFILYYDAKSHSCFVDNKKI